MMIWTQFKVLFHLLHKYCSNVTLNTADNNVYNIHDELSDPADFLEQYVEI